jgi:tripartite-type tricarboxylate transporter receptor subunit TctC
MTVTFAATPFSTVHVTGTGGSTDSLRRSIASQAGKRGLGKRLSLRVDDVTGTVFAIYRKA